MPLEIVRNFRRIYRNYYMEPTLRNFGQSLEIQAFDETGLGFENSYIYVNLSGAYHPSIVASTVIKSDKDGHIRAYIEVSPQVREFTIVKQKMVLALEWLHAMLGLRDGGFVGSAKISGNIELAILFHSLRRRSPWEDSPELKTQLHSAMRHLLVSTESMEEALNETSDIGMQEIRKLIQADPNRAFNIIENFVMFFASKWSVDSDLVFDRLQESIFQLA